MEVGSLPATDLIATLPLHARAKATLRPAWQRSSLGCGVEVWKHISLIVQLFSNMKRNVAGRFQVSPFACESGRRFDFEPACALKMPALLCVVEEVAEVGNCLAGGPMSFMDAHETLLPPKHMLTTEFLTSR